MYRSLRDRASWREYEPRSFLSFVDCKTSSFADSKTGTFSDGTASGSLITSIYHLSIHFIYHADGNFRITPSLDFGAPKSA